MKEHPAIERGSVRALAIETLIHDPNPVHWPLYTIEDMQRYAEQIEARVRADVEVVEAATARKGV